MSSEAAWQNDMDTCSTCQTSAKKVNGEIITEAEWARWMLWGCTCSPEVEAEAIAWFVNISN